MREPFQVPFFKTGIMEQYIEKLFENKKKLIFKLKKEKYAAYMNYFRKENRPFFTYVNDRMEQAQEKEEEAKKLAAKFVGDVTQIYNPGKTSFFGDSIFDYNLLMVYYVFPALALELQDNGRLLAGKICEEWKRRFINGNIGVSDYDTIYGSFREKIFGIF